MLIFKVIFTYLVDLRVKRQDGGIMSDKRKHIFNLLEEKEGGGGIDICDIINSCVLCTYRYMHEVITFHNKK